VSVETDAKKKELERQLAALRETYTAKLPDKFADLARLAAEARGTGSDASVDALMRFAHTLAGTSGSYGLDGVSVAARKVEHLVGDAQEGRGELVWEQIDAAVDAVLHAIPGASDAENDSPECWYWIVTLNSSSTSRPWAD
jgi:chemotaxis protein histidine kinase CheA